MPLALTFDRVTKEYARDAAEPAQVLREISLEIEAQEIFCIVGPSGCGKTTLINIAAGFIPATSGGVLIEERIVDGPQSRCGFTFQADAVFPWMTVAGNVGYGLRWNGTPPEHRRAIVDGYLQRVGLASFAEHWPRELSGGMRKRVDLARAFAVDPPVLFLDEPFGSLDVLTKEEMQQLLLDIWRSDRKTVLFVTHDVEEAVFLGHRVAVMSPSPGHIQEIFPIPFSLEERVPDLKLSSSFVAVRRDVLAVLGRIAERDGRSEHATC